MSAHAGEQAQTYGHSCNRLAHVELELVQVDHIVGPCNAHLPAEVVDGLRATQTGALKLQDPTNQQLSKTAVVLEHQGADNQDVSAVCTAGCGVSG